jgi:hypothetical protein
MADPNLKVNEELSRVDRHLAELARTHPDPKDLAGKVAGTSEETAALFGESEKSIDLIPGQKRNK